MIVPVRISRENKGGIHALLPFKFTMALYMEDVLPPLLKFS